MPLETRESETPEKVNPGTYNWSDRFWPPLQGNPFLVLVDPEYPARILKERKEALSRIALPLAHRLADPPEPEEPDAQDDPSSGAPLEDETP